MGAREPSTRERETIRQVFEQMAEGADFPISSYSKLYVIDAVLEYANLIGTTLYVSSASFRGNNLQALIAHEYGHLNNGDGSLILALRRLVFPPFSLFIGGIRDFSTNRPAYRPAVKEFDAMQIFYSMINNMIFFALAFIGGGLGVWVMSWAWAGYFRGRDYLADSFAAALGYRDLMLGYLEANIYFDTSVPYMLGWHPASELRIDALQYPGQYGLPSYEGVPAAAAAGGEFSPLTDVAPAGERQAPVEGTAERRPPATHAARNVAAIVLLTILGYLLFRAVWPGIQNGADQVIESLAAIPTMVAETFGGSEEGGVREGSLPGQVNEPGATVEEVPPGDSEEPYDCRGTVSASRAVTLHSSGQTCWLKLEDGETAIVDFHEEAQVTFRTASSGNDVYFYIAGPGDRLGNVVGATIRPIPFVNVQYGGLEEVKDFEVQYHSPGGQWTTCLRDVNQGYLGLTSSCAEAPDAPDEAETVVPLKSRAEVLVEYNSIYQEDGWCSLWDRLIDDGMVNGECPVNVLQWVYEDVDTPSGSVNLLSGLQMSASNDTEIHYQACAVFDDNAEYTGGSVEPWINDDFIGTNTTLHPGSVFTIYFRCDNAWSPPVAEANTLDDLLEADVLDQINKLGYDTAADFAEAWGLQIGSDLASGQIDPSEIATCPDEANGCVRITRETNSNGAVEWAFYARNPNSCRQDGYRREPGEDGQTGVPPYFEGLLEGVTIRRCQESAAITPAQEPANSGDQDCRGTELGPLVQGDHTLEAPVIVLQLWRMNGDSPWGSGEVTTVVENSVTIRGTGGNAWSYPAADCLEVATIEMQGGSNLRGSTIVSLDQLREAGMIE